jgi:hypothetical protein
MGVTIKIITIELIGKFPSSKCRNKKIEKSPQKEKGQGPVSIFGTLVR